MPIFSVFKLRVHSNLIVIMGRHVASTRNPELARKWHAELEEAKSRVEKVFAKECAEGWEGWPAEWSPQARMSSPIIIYPFGAWTRMRG